MSLQDQLLKAGLVDKKKAHKINKTKNKQVKQKQKNRIETTDETKLATLHSARGSGSSIFVTSRARMG